MWGPILFTSEYLLMLDKQIETFRVKNMNKSGCSSTVQTTKVPEESDTHTHTHMVSSTVTSTDKLTKHKLNLTPLH